MKYIFYILGILIVLTIGVALQLTRLKVEISEPAIVINDKIISEMELDERTKSGSYHSRGKGFLESIITRELLIQEAVRQGINQEEAFRKSVESFYEQSLVKILIDRKFQSLNPVITDEMVAKYTTLSGKTLHLTKSIFRNKEDMEKGAPQSSVELSYDFENMSDNLKFSLLFLKQGEFSPPEPTEAGYVTYRLEDSSTVAGAEPVTDAAQIKDFLLHQNKRIQFDNWLEQLKTSAKIQVLTKKERP
ncbi:MAG: hypothetical protein V2B19_11255 [Pseudomonadota bacterium]